MKTFIMIANFLIAVPLGISTLQHILRSGFEEQYEEPEKQKEIIRERRISFLIFLSLTTVFLLNGFYLYNN